jgi:hypothetical protein
MSEYIYFGIEDLTDMGNWLGIETKMSENHFMKYHYVNEYKNVDVEELVDESTIIE